MAIGLSFVIMLHQTGPQATLHTYAHWADVVGKIRSGDGVGVEELYAALSGGACSRILRRLDEQTAGDRLHEIMVIVLEAIRKGDLRDPDRLMGFVWTVTRRRAAAHIRSAVFQRRHSVALGHRELSAPCEQSPEARTARQERLDVVMKMLGSLRSRDREILERFYFREQEPSQICGEMHLTDTQFRLYKSRAIAKCYDLAHPDLRPVQFTRPV
jgi:RNA polymerase sigma-70 factor (ECF subfamily)